jgi:hypothetical protein
VKHEACDRMYEQVLLNGLDYMIQIGIECGYIQNEQEGIWYFEEIIRLYEYIEHYEKCGVLHQLLLKFKETQEEKLLPPNAF